MTTLLAKSTRFINDAAGLEKSMRMLQAVAQILASSSLSPVSAQPWLVARRQIALGRRYLRIGRFVGAFDAAFEVFRDGRGGGFRGVVEFVKWSFLGTYLGLESLTILDTMGVYETSWAAPVFLEAMKFWFYSLSASLLLGVIDWFSVPEQTSSKEKSEKENEAEEKLMAARRERDRKGRIAKNFVTDARDLFIPGSVTRWLALSSANVGWFSVVSTLLAGMDVWERVQGQNS